MKCLPRWGVQVRDFIDFEMIFSAGTASNRGLRRQPWPAVFIVTTKNLYFKIASHLKKMDFGGRQGTFSKETCRFPRKITQYYAESRFLRL